MKMYAKAFLIMLLLVLGYSLEAKKANSSDCLKHVNEIVDDFVSDMEKKYGLQWYGKSRTAPDALAEIEVFFILYKKVSIDQAREMEVYGIQELLRRINTHKKIRPYLEEYPFTVPRVGVSISFRIETGERPLDGSVALVFSARDKIFYDGAKMVMGEPTPFIMYTTEKNEVVTIMTEGKLEEDLIPLMNEPFEEAVKIVESSRASKKAS